jgi:hypothetical protein
MMSPRLQVCRGMPLTGARDLWIDHGRSFMLWDRWRDFETVSLLSDAVGE